MKTFLILVGALALPASSGAADLLTLYRTALHSDPVFSEARARLEAAREKLNQGRAGLLPTVTVSGNTAYNRDGIDNRSSPLTQHRDYNSHGLTLNLSQPLFRWQNWLGFDQSKVLVAQAEAVLAGARQELILRTAQAYFDVLQAEENLRSAESFRAAVAGQLDVASTAFDVGTGIQTDVHDAQARFELAASQVVAAQTDLEVRKRLLETIVGTLPSPLARRREGMSLPQPQPPDPASWRDAARQGNLTVQQQRLAVEVSDREVQRQRAGHYPTLDLVASAGRNATLNAGAREVVDAARIGLQLNVPLYQGGEVSSRAAEASANRRAALSALEAAQRSAAVAAEQAYLGVVNGQAQMRLLQAGLVAASSAATSNKEAFQIGVRLNSDVLNAESQVYATRRELSRASVEAVMAHLRLKASVGTLGEDDVAAANALLLTREK